MSQFKRVEDGIFIGPQPTEHDLKDCQAARDQDRHRFSAAIRDGDRVVSTG